MEAPKCKICGIRHWASEPHHLHENVPSNVMVAAPAEPRPPLKPKSPAEKKLETARETLLRVSEKRIVIKRGAPIKTDPKSPRAEYQRELMRKRRAKEKPNA